MYNITNQQAMNQSTIAAMLQAAGINKANEIAAIIVATPNIEVAVQILLGVYAAPAFDFTPTAICPPHMADPKVVNFDPFKNSIKYSYNRIPSVKVWVHKMLPEGTVLPSYDEVRRLDSSKAKSGDLFLSTGSYYDELALRIGMQTDEDLREIYDLTTIYGIAESELRYASCSPQDWNNQFYTLRIV
jgi:hypothetical protein